MLIRREQMDTFLRASDSRYEFRLVQFLRDEFPDAAQASETTLVAGTRQEIEKARSYGLSSEQQITIYVISAWLLGADFDNEFPAAAQMLRSDVTAKAKSDWLEEFTLELFHQLERVN